ncbi:MAG: LamG domain-containing protein [Verrucomicrobia bacterium]|nr:LamG domain-containing protein [Verrucomicrobiota bacterium]
MIVLAVVALVGAGVAQAEITFYDDFSSDPDIAGDWEYAVHYTAIGTATWISGDEDLDLSAAGGKWGLLSRTGATREADESVTMDITSLSASTTYHADWTHVGLAISSNAVPRLLGDTSPIYTFRLVSLGTNINAGLWQYQVIKHGGTGIYTSPTAFSFAPVSMGIQRNGDEYDFLADGGVIYTTTGTYSAVENNSMMNYHIVHGAGSFTTNDATVDNFGVVVELPQPVQYWRLDDNGGSTAANHISAGNVGTLVNTPTRTTSGLASNLTSRTDWPSTAALDLDAGATNDYIDCGNINLTSTNGGGEVTVSMWLNPDSLAGAVRLFTQPTGHTGLAGTTDVQTDGSISVWNGVTYLYAAPAGTVIVGTWQHLAFVWDTGQVTAYVDGVQKSTVTARFDFGSGHGNFGIAAKFIGLHGDGIDGKIDDIAIFDVALTHAEVAAVARGEEFVGPPQGMLFFVR